MGATCSSISAKFYEGPITNRTMRSVGVPGTDIICHMTPAIEVRVLNHLPLFHKFVITPNSPFNLLGRDLMHKLGCCYADVLCLIINYFVINSIISCFKSFEVQFKTCK